MMIRNRLPTPDRCQLPKLAGPLLALLVLLAAGSGAPVQGSGARRLVLPVVQRSAQFGWRPIPGASYSALCMDCIGGWRPSQPAAESHPDLNLALRGYAPTNALRALVSYNGQTDDKAPQLTGLLANGRRPTIGAVYRVNDWDWDREQRGAPLTHWDVSLLDVATTPGETIHVPPSGYEVGSGYEVVVLYASAQRITLKYTREDNVVQGYTLHLEGIGVDPALLALYRSCDRAGRRSLPALRAGQPFARAAGYAVGVAIRDHGQFMDPRSRKDWWRDAS